VDRGDKGDRGHFVNKSRNDNVGGGGGDDNYCRNNGIHNVSAMFDNYAY
jgi:hypothetical protein